jgi:hypothetical protein
VTGVQTCALPICLFFGGLAATWSQQTLRAVLRAHGQRCRRIGWIDVHTGLGPAGVGERIFACPDDAATFARARAWWGDVTSTYDGSSTSALLSGLMFNAAEQECAQAEHTGIALEYGTVPMTEVTEALRADHWLAAHPEKADAALRTATRQRMRDAFYTDTSVWKAQVVAQALEAVQQGIAGLSAA